MTLKGADWAILWTIGLVDLDMRLMESVGVAVKAGLVLSNYDAPV